MNAIVDQARANVVAKGLTKTSRSIPVFVYRDDFDEKHYPVKDFMIDRLIGVHNQLNLPDGAEWGYYATAHGVIFEYLECNRVVRLDLDDLKFLSNLPNIRHIDVKSNSFSFALTHYEETI